MDATIRKASLTSIFLSLILLAVPSAKAADTPFDAKATAVTGQVMVTPLDAKAAIELKVGQTLTQGDTVSTGSGSSLEIQYPDGSKTMVGSDTKFVIRKMAKVGKKSTQVSLGLLNGKMRSTVAKLWGKESRFEYVTKTSICGVAGTDVSAEAGGEGEKFSIGKAGVAVIFPNESTVKLASGKLITPNQTMIEGKMTYEPGAGERLKFATEAPRPGVSPLAVVGAVGVMETQVALSRMILQQTGGGETPDIVNQAMAIAGRTNNTTAMGQVLSGREGQAAALAAVAANANPQNAAAIAAAVANAAPDQAAAVAATLAATNPTLAASIAAAVVAANPAAAATIVAAVSAVAPSAAAAVTASVATATNTDPAALSTAAAAVPAATVSNLASGATSANTAAAASVNTMMNQPINPAVTTVAPALEPLVTTLTTTPPPQPTTALEPLPTLADIPPVVENPNQTTSPGSTTLP